MNPRQRPASKRARIAELDCLADYLEEHSPAYQAFSGRMDAIVALMHRHSEETDPAQRARMEREQMEVNLMLHAHRRTRLDRAIDAHLHAIDAEITLLRAKTPQAKAEAEEAFAQAQAQLQAHPGLDQVLTSIARRTERQSRASAGGDAW